MTDKDASQPKHRTFRQSYWQPPRAHGEVIEGRSVSFLETAASSGQILGHESTTHGLTPGRRFEPVTDLVDLRGEPIRAEAAVDGADTEAGAPNPSGKSDSASRT